MIHLQKFILYSISVITIIIIDGRQSIIKINFLIKTWGAKKIIFIKCSIPKLIDLHIISIKSIQRRHTSNIVIMKSMQIKFHRFFDFLFKHFMSQFKVQLIKLSHFLLFSISLTSENKNKKQKDLIAESKDIPSSTHSPQQIASLRVCVCLLPYFPGNGARNSLMSTHASILVDYVGPPSAEVCRTAAISLKWMT